MRTTIIRKLFTACTLALAFAGCVGDEVAAPEPAVETSTAASAVSCTPGQETCDYGCNFDGAQWDGPTPTSDDCIIRCNASGTRWELVDNCGCAELSIQRELPQHAAAPGLSEQLELHRLAVERWRMAALEPAPPAACDVQSAPAAHTGHRRPEMLSIAVPGRPDPYGPDGTARRIGPSRREREFPLGPTERYRYE